MFFVLRSFVVFFRRLIISLSGGRNYVVEKEFFKIVLSYLVFIRFKFYNDISISREKIMWNGII